MRLGTPSGLSRISTGVPSSRNGMSSSGRILAMTPLLPWRPAILSPTEMTPLGGDVDLDHLQHARGQLVAALQAVEPALLLVLEGLDPRRVLADDLARPWLPASGLRRSSALELEPLALLDQVLGVLVAAQRLAGRRVGHRSADQPPRGP